jgi:microcin C transport system permease protein
MERLDYFGKRLLLMVPTFLAITVICFGICQLVPGGPVEQALLRLRGQDGGEMTGSGSTATVISEEQREALKSHFGFDKPLPVRYKQWLVEERLGMTGYSYKFSNKTVWELIRDRLPISLIFGIPGFFLTYLVCIPLGIFKALRDGSVMDVGSSIIVFVGYAIPAFALGMVLQLLVCGTVENMPDIFPAVGVWSENFEELSFIGKILDVAHHMFLPVLCYVIGNFAVLTVLMKNSLMDEVGKDYVRTVLAKGASSRRAVWCHVLRNSLIPIATGVGAILSVMVAGSVLIERVFEIPGMGSLSLEAIISRDYAVFMGILSLTAILGMLGNLLSDFCYVLIDPRINFR